MLSSAPSPPPHEQPHSAQRHVAHILFELPEADGYALASGAALIVRQVVTRETDDLDAFIDARAGSNSGTIDRLADAFAAEAARRGCGVQTVRRHPTFCRYLIDCDGQKLDIDLAVDAPALEPWQRIDGLPVLTVLDLAARKVLAIVDRLEARDYTDLHALALIIGQQVSIDAALSLDAGLRTAHIAVRSFRATRNVHISQLSAQRAMDVALAA